MAVRRAGDQLVVCNVDADKYPEKVFGVDPAQASPQAGARGALLPARRELFRGWGARMQKRRSSFPTGIPGSNGAEGSASGSLRQSMPSVARPLALHVLLQEVDVGKHNWGNYFLAAYKVGHGLGWRAALTCSAACCTVASQPFEPPGRAAPSGSPPCHPAWWPLAQGRSPLRPETFLSALCTCSTLPGRL